MAIRPMAPVPAITPMWRISDPVTKRAGAGGVGCGTVEAARGAEVFMAGLASGVGEVDARQLPQPS